MNYVTNFYERGQNTPSPLQLVSIATLQVLPQTKMRERKTKR